MYQNAHENMYEVQIFDLKCMENIVHENQEYDEFFVLATFIILHYHESFLTKLEILTSSHILITEEYDT